MDHSRGMAETDAATLAVRTGGDADEIQREFDAAAYLAGIIDELADE